MPDYVKGVAGIAWLPPPGRRWDEGFRCGACGAPWLEGSIVCAALIGTEMCRSMDKVPIKAEEELEPEEVGE